jgi:hypothetical protein
MTYFSFIETPKQGKATGLFTWIMGFKLIRNMKLKSNRNIHIRRADTL